MASDPLATVRRIERAISSPVTEETIRKAVSAEGGFLHDWRTLNLGARVTAAERAKILFDGGNNAICVFSQSDGDNFRVYANLYR